MFEVRTRSVILLRSDKLIDKLIILGAHGDTVIMLEHVSPAICTHLGPGSSVGKCYVMVPQAPLARTN